MSHIITPVKNNENVLSDKSLAERIFQVLITWGKKAIVVNNPAVKPNNCVIVFLIYLQNTETFRTFAKFLILKFS
jgi:hypothetical protein